MQTFSTKDFVTGRSILLVGEDVADAVRRNIWDIKSSHALKKITDVEVRALKYPSRIHVNYIGHYNNCNDGREDFCKQLSFDMTAEDGTPPEDLLPEEIFFEEIPRIARQDRWHAKVGLIGKTYKLHKNIVDDFADACKKNDISLSQQLEKMMRQFIDETNEANGGKE